MKAVRPSYISMYVFVCFHMCVCMYVMYTYFLPPDGITKLIYQIL